VLKEIIKQRFRGWGELFTGKARHRSALEVEQRS
jgi:hypothetical protein